MLVLLPFFHFQFCNAPDGLAQADMLHWDWLTNFPPL